MDALIPRDTGARLATWPCSGGDTCRGCYQNRKIEQYVGDNEAAAITRATEEGWTTARIHVLDSGALRTFKVWRAAGKYTAREVL